MKAHSKSGFLGCMVLLGVCVLQCFFGPSAAEAASQEPVRDTSQLLAVFPDEPEAGEEFAQNRRTFKGYKGRGEITLKNHGAQTAEVYINGRKIPLGDLLNLPAGTAALPIGAYSRDGVNTLKVLNIQPAGARLEVRIAYPALITGSPEQAGFSAAGLRRIDRVLEDEVQKGFPGAVLLVMRNGRIVKQTAYGWAKMYEQTQLLPEAKRQSMQVDTMFDLASNTKMYATILAFMKLTEEGRVSPEDKIVQYLPEYTGDGREEICIRDIMTHSAGYAAVFPFNQSSAGEFYSRQREKTISLLCKVPLTYPRGTKTLYSDTDYMLLAAILEKITGRQLDAYVEQEIYYPLGLSHILFNPLRKGFKPSDFAATEPCGNTRSGMVSFPGIRSYTIQGEVHDERAFYAMDGVSGHAGLFSNAQDLAVLAQLMLNQGGYGGYRLCSAKTLEYFTKPTDANPLFGLGWNKMSMPGRVWEFGPYASGQAIAHSGWTGTDICIDPAYDLAIVLLTNRVHAPNVPGKPNTFQMDDFAACSYGSILAMVYEAFMEK